jgi:hypothetical protein
MLRHYLTGEVVREEVLVLDERGVDRHDSLAGYVLQRRGAFGGSIG